MPDAPISPPLRGRSRLARRLFLLFVLVAIVPLALTDWIATLATGQVAERLAAEHHRQAVRQASRQVLDRLLAGKTLLLAQAESQAGGAPSGLGRVFSQVVHTAGVQPVSWPPHAAGELLQAWGQADSGLDAEGSLRGAIDAQLRVDFAVPHEPRVMLGVQRQGRLLALGVLEPGYLWAPFADAALDSAWWVHDGRGRLVAHHTGEDYALRIASQEPDEIVQAHADLFLAGELLAGEWKFTQRSPREPVHWFGMPLALWLGAVAASSLLVIAALSHWRIRRLLEPLANLTAVTRRIAAGMPGVRAGVQRDDEIGELAEAFDEMAERIEAQFDALQGLATIDREILAGAPFERVVGHALQRIAARHANACATVVWRDGPAALRQAWLAPATEGARLVLSERLEPGEEELGRFAAVADDEQRSAQAAGPSPSGVPPACLRLAGIERCAESVLLPVRHEEHTVAMLALGFANAPLPAALQALREVRDRLAVALGARLHERELVHRAAHDSLTGLANRFGLQERLEAALVRSALGAKVALVSIDLDHFKDVNDTLGHEAGDELLRAASHRLQSCVPAGATVARLGGDEFVVLLQDADEATAVTVASLAIAALGRPFALRGGEHLLGASAGIALAPAHGRSREELLRCADIALFAAKGASRRQHVLFTAELDRAARDRVQMQTELRHAIDREEFVLHFQPRVRPADGKVISAEALLRWQHPQRGLLPPGAFIELAEACGVIEEIGAWVLDAACAQAAAWRRQGIALGRLSINVSTRQFVSGDLPARVRSTLERHRLPGNALELEVTESLLMNDPGEARAQLAELRGRGVTVALDDFGTGYSSMAMLRQLPIDVMKVDRSFVVGLGHDDGAMAVTRAIVALAHSLRLHLVAEGVETEAQAEVLRALGCDELQGYLFSRPVPAAQFPALPGLAPPATGGRLSLVPGRPA